MGYWDNRDRRWRHSYTLRFVMNDESKVYIIPDHWLSKNSLIEEIQKGNLRDFGQWQYLFDEGYDKVQVIEAGSCIISPLFEYKLQEYDEDEEEELLQSLLELEAEQDKVLDEEDID